MYTYKHLEFDLGNRYEPHGGDADEVAKLHTQVLMNMMECTRQHGQEHFYQFIYRDKVYRSCAADLRAILKNREHVPTKQERKQLRQQKAQHGH